MKTNLSHEAKVTALTIKGGPDPNAICKLCGARFDEGVDGVCPGKLSAKPEPTKPAKATQVGPPAMIGDYRIRVVSDTEHPDWLAKASWEDPNSRGGSGFIYDGGPPWIGEILVADSQLLITHENGLEQRIPVAALEALLKVAGWKVEKPR